MKLYQAKDYQPICHALFSDYRDKILSLLPQARVEHIGSSAITNCISKGDLDIFVGVELTEFEQSVQHLYRLGFHEKQNTMRTNSLCMLECDDNQDVALQVVANGSEFEFFLEFRDKLLANPRLIAEYNVVKTASSNLTEDDYRARKSEFIKSVLSHD